MPAKRSRKRRPNPLAARSKPEIKYLDRERAMSAVAEIEVLFHEGDKDFPPVTKTLWKMLNDDSVIKTEQYDKDGNVKSSKERERVTAKDRIKIIETMAKFIGLRERALAEAGVGKKGPKKVVNNNNFTQVNLSHDELQSLPEEIRDKLVAQTLTTARGGIE